MLGNTEVNMQILFVVRILLQQCGCQVPGSIPQVLSFPQSQFSTTLNAFPEDSGYFLNGRYLHQQDLFAIRMTFYLALPYRCTIMNLEELFLSENHM